jgi:hypothetical protein
MVMDQRKRFLKLLIKIAVIGFHCAFFEMLRQSQSSTTKRLLQEAAVGGIIGAGMSSYFFTILYFIYY